jgi:hypothetical protein
MTYRNSLDFNITLVDNKCFNYLCYAKNYCSLYDKKPTYIQQIQFTPISCSQCRDFIDNRKYAHRYKTMQIGKQSIIYDNSEDKYADQF